MLVKVTEEDILQGSHQPESCPFALAILRACPSLKNYLLVGTSITALDGSFDEGPSFINPPEMADWIRKYDGVVRLSFEKEKEAAKPIAVDLPLEQYCD